MKGFSSEDLLIPPKRRGALHMQRLTNLSGRNTSPKWSPDGKKISFDHAAQGECDIFTIDAPRK